jgi:hypothetical protein
LLLDVPMGDRESKRLGQIFSGVTPMPPFWMSA